MDDEKLRRSIRETAQYPWQDYSLRNPRIIDEWPELFGHPYELPGGGSTSHLDGRSSFSASWFMVANVENRLYRRIGRLVFEGGVGHCETAGGREFALQVADTRVHFRQNENDWASYFRYYVLFFYSRLLWQMLTEREKEQYLWVVQESQTQVVSAVGDFHDLLQDYAKFDGLSTRDQRDWERTLGQAGVTSRIEVIEHILRDDTLRARRLQNALITG